MRILQTRYRLERAVGHGGMAAVWQARDLVLHRAVAVKVLAPELAGDAGLTRAVLDEARAAAQLSHPHLAGVYDYGETSDGGHRLPFVVMEFIDGTTVADHLAANGAMAWADALSVCRQVADALAAAHRVGLVHRDVKPGNVMLTPTGVKLVDFGIAVPAGQLPVDSSGRLWGTPGYLPPEQLRREHAVPAGDVYALGLLLYECLAGGPAWRASDVDALIKERRRTPVPELPSPDDRPAVVDALYRRCLSTDPTARPSAAEVARLCREAEPASSAPSTAGATLRAETPELLPTVPRRRHSRRAVAMAAAPVAVLIGTLGTNLVTSRGDEAAQAGTVSDEKVASCTAAYSSNRRADGSFTARLRMANTGEAPLSGWSARFTVPAGHHVTGIAGISWEQRANRVTVTADNVLRPGAAATLTVEGTFDQSDDAPPTAFRLNGSECARAVTQIRSPGGTPAARVADGGDRPRTTPVRSSRTGGTVAPERENTPASPPSSAAATSPMVPSSSSPYPSSPASPSPTEAGPSGTPTSSAPAGEPTSDPSPTSTQVPTSDPSPTPTQVPTSKPAAEPTTEPSSEPEPTSTSASPSTAGEPSAPLEQIL
ncbi:MAG: protein kinase [Actinomycetota bacterium]|nr:protein kinase [Actinomycetota bacterium]